MARFVTSSMPAPVPKPGAHVARIIRAVEKTSENGNSVLRMTARFPDQSELSFAITFVARAAKLVGFFCRSCDLELPKADGIEVEISPADVQGRIFYPVVELDGEGLESVPKITKFPEPIRGAGNQSGTRKNRPQTTGGDHAPGGS